MRKLKKLLAALAISGLAYLPLANSAQAQVVVYNHGQRVRVAQTASQDWSKIKARVKGDTYRMSHGGRTSPVIQQQPMSYSGNYRTGTFQTRTTIRTNTLGYRTRFNSTRSSRERMRLREAQNRARLERERSATLQRQR
jgi:hypothetical protein